MLILFSGHVEKDLGRVRMFFSQTLCEVDINPSIFLLAADGQCENLLFRKLIERFHFELSNAIALLPIGQCAISRDLEISASSGRKIIRRVPLWPFVAGLPSLRGRDWRVPCEERQRQWRLRSAPSGTARHCRNCWLRTSDRAPVPG